MKGLSICVGILALGLFIECAQWFIGRGFSPLDLVRNSVGVCIGATSYIAWISSARRRVAALAFASLLLAGSYVPTVAFFVSGNLAPAPPTLADFEQWGVAQRMRSKHAIIRIDHNDSLWPANATLSARIQFQPDGDWPSILFAEVNPQWNRFQQFSFRVFNPQATPLKLHIRVDDKDLGPTTKNRITISRTVNPGESVITIPLEEFRQQALKADYPGQPLMKCIESFVLFMDRLDESATLVFDDIELQNL